MLGFHFFHHIVQLVVQLQHKRPREHRSQISEYRLQFRDQNTALEYKLDLPRSFPYRRCLSGWRRSGTP